MNLPTPKALEYFAVFFFFSRNVAVLAFICRSMTYHEFF